MNFSPNFGAAKLAQNYLSKFEFESESGYPFQIGFQFREGPLFREVHVGHREILLAGNLKFTQFLENTEQKPNLSGAKKV